MNTDVADPLIAAELLALEFINSEWGDFRGRWRVDNLSKPAWLGEFMAKWHLEVDEAPTESEFNALITLRTLMRRIVESLLSGGPDAEDLKLLNGIFQSAPSIHHLVWQKEKFELEIVPLVKNWSWVMAEIAGSFTELLVYGDLQRLKICKSLLPLDIL